MSEGPGATSGVCSFCDAVIISNSTEESFSHHNSMEALENSAVVCWLCCLFVKSLTADPEPDLPNDGWYSEAASLRIQNDCINIKILPSGGFSGMLPFRYFRPDRGYGTDLKEGKIVVVLADGPAMDAIKMREIWRAGNGPNLSVKRRLSLVGQWLSDCRHTHKACSSSTRQNSSLPTRVIDVGSNPVRLYVPSQGQVAQYAALSYCWGGEKAGDRNIKTTTQTIEKRKTCLFLVNEIVPATIQDAIDITKELGIPYLWIDALCIIQDDNTDWEIEASKMHSVYEKAEVTLSATDSKGCGCGFFSESMNKLSSFEKISFMEQHEFRSQKVYACLETVKDNIRQSLNDSPLAARGWTFQESILSRRLVHFTKKQLIWECKSLVATEEGMISWSSKQIPGQFSPSISSTGNFLENWEAVVKDYSRREFREPEDRVFALAGVISKFQNIGLDKPLLGLWKSSLAQGLLWFVQVPPDSQDPPEARLSDVPSWSWMSVKGGVQYHSIQGGDPLCVRSSRPRRQYNIVVQEHKGTVVTWEGTPLTSKIGSAILCLRGPVMMFEALETRYDLETWLDVQDVKPTRALLILRSKRVVYRGGDSRKRPSMRMTTDFYFILLSPSSQGEKYRRVGMAIIKAHARMFAFELKEEDAPKETLMIC